MIAQLAAFEGHALDLKAETIEFFFAHVGLHGDACGLQALDELHGGRLVFQCLVDQLDKLVSGRLIAGTLPLAKLAVSRALLIRHEDFSVLVLRAFRDHQVVHFFETLNDLGAFQVLVLAQVQRAVEPDAAGNNVDVLPVLIVMHDVDALVGIAETHSFHVVISDLRPLLVGQLVALGQT